MTFQLRLSYGTVKNSLKLSWVSGYLPESAGNGSKNLGTGQPKSCNTSSAIFSSLLAICAFLKNLHGIFGYDPNLNLLHTLQFQLSYIQKQCKFFGNPTFASFQNILHNGRNCYFFCQSLHSKSV